MKFLRIGVYTMSLVLFGYTIYICSHGLHILKRTKKNCSQIRDLLMTHPLILNTFKVEFSESNLEKLSLQINYPLTTYHPIVGVLIAYNVQKEVEKTLDSLLAQNYLSWRLICIDNGSLDNTYLTIEKWMQQHHQEHRVTLIRHAESKPLLYNFFLVSTLTDDQDILFPINPKLEYFDNQLLNKINFHYQNPDVWMTYGIKNKYTQVFPSFYKALFKTIPIKTYLKSYFSFLHQDSRAVIYPMTIIAQNHILFAQDLLHLCDFSFSESVSLPAPSVLTPIRTLFSKDPSSIIQSDIDLFIISSNPQKLKKCLDSHLTHLTHLHKITVFYETQDPQLRRELDLVLEAYPYVNSMTDEVLGDSSLRSILLKTSALSSSYIAFAKEDFILQENINPLYLISEMEKSGAIAFILGHYPFSFDPIPLTKELSFIRAHDFIHFPLVPENGAFALLKSDLFFETILKRLHPTDFLGYYFSRVATDTDFVLMHNQKKAQPQNIFQMIVSCKED